MQLPGDGQLHGVIGPQSMRLGQGFGIGQQGGCNFQNVVLSGGVLAELGKSPDANNCRLNSASVTGLGDGDFGSASRRRSTASAIASSGEAKRPHSTWLCT